MSALLAILAALAQAVCAAVAGILQHATAVRGRTPGVSATGHLGRFARSQLAQPLWWAALAVQGSSLVLHALALQLGSLTLVQPTIAVVVVLALPLNHLVEHTRVTLPELGWAVLATASLAGFLVAASPRLASVPLALSQLVVPGLIAIALIVAGILVARRASARLAAGCLGAAAGVAFSLEAALLQAVTVPLLHDPAAALATPGPYALVVFGAAGVALTQLAYRAGPISWGLPAIVAANPIASVVLDYAAAPGRGEASAAALIAQAVALAALVVAVVALAHTSPAAPRASST